MTDDMLAFAHTFGSHKHLLTATGSTVSDEDDMVYSCCQKRAKREKEREHKANKKQEKRWNQGDKEKRGTRE